ncbi:hypothetical protein BASA50_002073 [Batrachochytrium salamandrivorans]|uniref:EF-hand domain-containing protein n=1 Tax=Batrachochytrium salamandrivorans TaxID=1357716 RepID=A0ABQ8FMA0_9FUNG|nr:hypothetical protein BASA62_006973 [Batrachochytrium salamandrivorans]KAH6580460.1 hypothetical protein BASA60_002857 [Batrachochytrium salamandrivorans]KAH6599520.1 hypothetical protein BASA61_002536 [Batrachochytrium salamandrivorans]KAH6600689.1 hypothetical protein BASA50_002073 [Batrachochytrium salamandrivorans]KAH9271661.1 hypothetical protein BASA83_006029 [Batrachochytrium salamandrivorans]
MTSSTPTVAASSLESTAPSSSMASTISAIKALLPFGIEKTDRMHHEKAFVENASGSIDGEKYLSLQEFCKAIQPKHGLFGLSVNHATLLFRVADRTQRGTVSHQEFMDFHALLSSPHAEFEILSQLVKDTKSHQVTLNGIKSFLAAHRSPLAVPFEFASESLRPYLAGLPLNRNLTLQEVGETAKALQHEQLLIEYKRYDPKNTGRISGENFRRLLDVTSKHRMSARLLENFPDAFPEATFAEVVALQSVLSKLDVVGKIVTATAAKSVDGTVTNSSFSKTASKMMTYDAISPLEVDVIFRSLGVKADTKIVPDAFDPLLNPSYRTYVAPLEPIRLSATMEFAKSVYNFGLGAIAGAIGATFVYPIDLVKTRIQNQRSKVVGQLLYRNSWDCFRKVVRNEGVLGLYSGLLPQLVGVAPEKAIKLTMNDLLRGKLRNTTTGELPLWAEIAAGCAAGGSQVMFTNPLEIVKIRLQVQGEVAKAGIEGSVARQSAVGIVKQLGLFGLYKGVGACLLRDIPFSGIYFPAYAHLKKDLFNEGKNGKKLGVFELLIAGALAGMPAAYLVTPADVIKTRLQVAARKGESTYSGILDATRKIFHEEGASAFFKGGIARVMRSSPQFGVTLAAYEFLHNLVPVDFGDSPVNVNAVLASAAVSPSEVGLRNTLRVLGDLSLLK